MCEGVRICFSFTRCLRSVISPMLAEDDMFHPSGSESPVGDKRKEDI